MQGRHTQGRIVLRVFDVIVLSVFDCCTLSEVERDLRRDRGRVGVEHAFCTARRRAVRITTPSTLSPSLSSATPCCQVLVTGLHAHYSYPSSRFSVPPAPHTNGHSVVHSDVRIVLLSHSLQSTSR